MRSRRFSALGAGVRLLVALAALAAGQSVAARAEASTPRTTVERVVSAPEELRVAARASSTPVHPDPEQRRRVEGSAPAAISRDISGDTPLYLLHRALLL